MSHKGEQYKNGLKQLPHDPRDYKLGRVAQDVSIKQLPEEYSLPVPDIKDQKGSDFCSAFASCYVSEYQEKMVFEPSWSFAASKKISGDVEQWGQDLRSACKAHTKYGALPVQVAPYSLRNKKSDFLRFFHNWDNDLVNDAEPYKKKSYISAKDGSYDAFDNIRVSLYKFRQHKAAAIIGLEWGWGSDAKVIDKPKSGYGHALAVIGWKQIKGKPYLIIVNSWGSKAGDNGVHYLSREVINANVPKYGAYIFLDMLRETVEYHNIWELDVDWSIWKKWWRILRQIFYV